MSNPNSHKNEVYVFGAGLNRSIFNPYLSASPPLMEDFFQIAMRINERLGKPFENELKPLLDYIYKNWNLTRNDILTKPFNLERCFTVLEYQYGNALQPGMFVSLIDLFDLRFKLRTLIFKVLSQFNGCQFQSDLWTLGEILFMTKPGIITFNYDDYVESVIEVVSQKRINHDTHLSSTLKGMSRIRNSPLRWNRTLAYGIAFDIVPSPTHLPYLNHYIDGNVFYRRARNKLYTRSILKLHGSLNWLRFIPTDATPPSLPKPRGVWSKDMESQIILSHAEWAMDQHPMINGNYVEPVIVTPDIYKSKRLEDPLFGKALLPLWKQAGNYLSNCKKLVIIGYSFPDADDLVQKLFQNAFSENTLEKLIVVNPDSRAVEKSKMLCKFQEVLQFNNLKEFLEKGVPFFNRKRSSNIQ